MLLNVNLRRTRQVSCVHCWLAKGEFFRSQVGGLCSVESLAPRQWGVTPRSKRVGLNLGFVAAEGWEFPPVGTRRDKY